MASDETTICNLALAHLGQSQIMSLDDESQAARFCKRFYAQTRDEVVQSHQWNFALKRTTLPQLATAPLSGWALQYELPVDFLRLVQLNGYEWWQREKRWEIEGRALLTDETTAAVRYLARVEDANFFTPLFVDALAMKLAARLAKPLTGSASAEADFLGRYEKITGPLARRMDAVEGRPKRKPAWVQSDLVTSRRIG